MLVGAPAFRMSLESHSFRGVELGLCLDHPFPVAPAAPLPSLPVCVAVTVTVSPGLSSPPSLCAFTSLSFLPAPLLFPFPAPPCFSLPLSSDSELGWLPEQVLCWLMDEPLLVSSRRHEMSRLPHLCGRARGLLRAPSGGPEQTWAWEGFGNKRHSGCDPKAELRRRVFQTHLSFIIVCWSLSVFKGLLELDWPD